MVKFVRIDHQFTLFDYNTMRPKTKIPLKRISKERYEEALSELQKGKSKNMLGVLRDVNDALDNYLNRL